MAYVQLAVESDVKVFTSLSMERRLSFKALFQKPVPRSHDADGDDNLLVRLLCGNKLVADAGFFSTQG